MKTTRNALFALLLLAAGTVTAAQAQVSIGAGVHIGPSGRAAVDLGFFYDNLAPYGNWIQRPNYGWVWAPTAVSTAWRPYENGHWVWTDQGWTWITDEPYGWATYHYGRWYQDPQIGWAWVPGNDWGPAWVSWQEGANYVGWAPLPPGVDISASYNSGYGYNGGYGGGYGYNGGGYGSYDYGIGPDAYVFVPERNFLSLSIGSYIVPQVQVRGFWGQTHNYTSYRREGDRFFNQGVPVDRIQRVVGRSVPRYQIADLQTTDYRQPRTRIAGNQVQIFRPQVQRNVQVAPPASRPVARRSVVSATEFQQQYPNRANRANRAGRAPQVQGTTAPNPTIQGQQRNQRPAVQGQQQNQGNGGKTWNQIQAERRQQRPANNQPGNQPQVQPTPERNRNQQPRPPQVQAQPDRQRRNDTPAVQAQPRNPQREQAQQDRYQRPPQRQQPPQVQPQPKPGNPNPGAQGPKDNNNNRGKAKQKQKDRNRDRDHDQNPPPPGR